MGEGANRIAMVAGEASGDQLGAHLIAALKARRPQLRFSGVGGPRMAAQGFKVDVPMDRLAVRGYVEALRHYREIMRIRTRLGDALLRDPPGLFIGVDASDFNLDLERRLDPEKVTRIRELVREATHVDDKVLEYIVRLGRATRAPESAGLPELRELLVLGLSPRSYQHVLALARVTAFLHGRDYVLPGDVKEVFPDAARHRVARSVRAEAEGVSTDTLLARIADAVEIP